MLQLALGGLSGILVGFVLGLVGGGGSILAVPLMLYLVGIDSPHVAIGTSALAVAANALSNLFVHARRGNVRWPCASVFALAGIAGAYLGSSLGKAVDGQRLLFMFALLMVVIGILMLRKRNAEGDASVRLSKGNMPALLGLGAFSGALSGFFGIGGGFLVVPGLMAATGMPMLAAIGSSLVAVSAFGLTTAINYAQSGLVNWPLAAAFVVAGSAGGIAGARASAALAEHRGVLNVAFALLIFMTAAYMLWQMP
ncbi:MULTISPECIES: sulfite exporter TauE/SafE family protein [Stenotrophomonas]|uniref:Probable membrane transporter protein n=1 Tax=Stenotrophomonas maltophilia TaxID=40324 RepID=A0A2J0SUB8_STEMA|nr:MULTISPECIES: sulfite exporter TauE/SafE family protein [Stenotrophomonas]AVO32691.1 sulfite exporter TauE/SafE family protein [Stenotrophomonas maltophilia]AWT16986.1 sulfite exporter TauE/SafE family protein [Stenotrophomonas maltophilia]EKT4441678.1 sulfite exporter TauE/SafE family protein [Stenotrophomonas maltophilia]ELF4099546.1 sulfite exporter TauE/SafE family protein [Stenotrophomonas maltophilia]MBA0287190.1 sulfite exporter TauE/SafE family protein [Stenotrophomonas maltophilia]